MNKAAAVALIYADADSSWAVRLQRHISEPVRRGLINLWTPEQVLAGSHVGAATWRAMTTARIAILLVSADFLASDWLMATAIPALLHAEQRLDRKLFRIAVRAHMTPTDLAEIPTLLDGAVPLSELDQAAQEEALKQCAIHLMQECGIPAAALDPDSAARLHRLATDYRRCVENKFNTWRHDPMFPRQPDMRLQPAVAFDDVFYPLRLRAEERVQSEDTLDILTMTRPGCRLRVLAAGGMGKSTWLQAVFRRLVRAADMLPVLLELRKLAARLAAGQTGTRQEQALEAELLDWGRRCKVPAWEEGFAALLHSSHGPVPVLLLDGWDEAGSQGSTLKELLLGFLWRYPRVAVIITSRHHGTDLPSSIDGFATWSLQSLSDEDVLAFAQRYLRAFGASDPDEDDPVEKFGRAVRQSPPTVRQLTRSPLLLTLMLHNYRELPLPGRRHALLEECVRLLLAARPESKEDQGARLPERCYRPADRHERISVTAVLAHRMFASPADCGHSYDELEAMLPRDWPSDADPDQDRSARRRGFLAWLVSVAGVLSEDEATRRLSFANESLREYLVAYHLNACTEGNAERTRVFLDIADKPAHWEVLLLWAAMMHSSDLGRPEKRIPPILVALHAEGLQHLRLAGAILAEGTGDEAAFAQWLGHVQRLISSLPEDPIAGGLGVLFGIPWAPRSEAVFDAAWATSQQPARRSSLAQRLASLAAGADVLRVIAVERLARRCGLTLPVLITQPGTAASALLAEFRAPAFGEARRITVGRLLADLAPGCLSGERGIAFLPLLLWPSQRRLAGQLLQLAAVLGAGRPQLTMLGAKLLRPLPRDEDTQKQHHDLRLTVAAVVQAFAEGKNRHDFPEVTALLEHFMSAINTAVLLHLGSRRERKLESTPILSLAALARSALQIAQSTMQQYLRGLGRIDRALLDILVAQVGTQLLGALVGLPAEAPWLQSYAIGSLLILSGVEAGRLLVNLQEGPLAFMILAYKASLMPSATAPRVELLKALDEARTDIDPLYPALARYLARLATPQDKSLLLALATGSEPRPEPLSLMLRSAIRGTIETDDGLVALDELSEHCGYSPLPYLDEPVPLLPIDPTELARRIALLKQNQAVRARDWQAWKQAFWTAARNTIL